MKVAVACPGLGRIRRGFEAFAEDLFQHLLAEGTHDVTLFKGGGEPASSELALWNIDRRSPLWRLLVGVVDPYIGEQITFALSLARRLKRQSFDIVHVSDCQVASLLAHLTRGQRNRSRIVYSNGGPYDPDDYRRFDFIQQVNPVEMERAVAHGVDPARMMLVPYGVDTGVYRPPRGTSLRGTLGIPNDSFLLLSVGSHGVHKRLDFLIRQMDKVGTNVHLLVVGQTSPEDFALREVARQAAGGRVSFASFPHADMPNVYGSADVYVHGALSEGFGLAMVEAMACGIPILHHPEAGMNWVVGDGGVEVNMADGEALSDCIRTLASDAALRNHLSSRARRRAEETFSWEVVLSQYHAMYGRAMVTPLGSS